VKIRIKVKGVAGEWTEDYDQVGIKDLWQAESWAAGLIDNFNNTLRPGESRRELLGTEIIGASTAHDWFKRTDGMSVRFQGGLVDVMECSKCGITGKRQGVSSVIKRDSKYRAKKFAICGAANSAPETAPPASTEPRCLTCGGRQKRDTGINWCCKDSFHAAPAANSAPEPEKERERK
jgi:hypothetical protein